MSEHCPGCGNEQLVDECPGVTCAACAAKDAEIARLRALVAVGREMATWMEDLARWDFYYNDEYEQMKNLRAKWRSLEDKE